MEGDMQETIEHIETDEQDSNISSGEWERVAPGLYRTKIMMVNVYFVGEDADNWVLVDAGLAGSADTIKNVAEEIYGEGAKPRCIVLTHGHFDHIGALKELIDEWGVTVYAHELELPYLQGMSDYPPADPTVGGGLMALSSFMYPRSPIDLGDRVWEFPEDRDVPGMEDWIILETPGHSPGHVSFFRASDKVLIAGDAVVTTKQESAFSVLTQKKELNGPPMYFTPDWRQAEESVKKIAQIKPSVVATGHGIPMRGEELEEQLAELAHNFKELAVPTHGRYVDSPAVAGIAGVVSVPPPAGPSPRMIAGATAFALGAIGGLLYMNMRKKTADQNSSYDRYSQNNRRELTGAKNNRILGTNVTKKILAENNGRYNYE
jgi:glyoxylase-like metal-dependent hydrolase (beta-lactamase superfamily II)